MQFSREFYALNLAFAKRVHQVAGIPFELALMQYTNLNIHFGLRQLLDPSHPTWQEYITGLNQTEDDIGWTYQFALEHGSYSEIETLQPTFGCFSYTIWDENRVRLHFHNREESGISPLSDLRLSARLEELSALVGYVKQYEPQMKTVVGGSWLYNLHAYRRLFPAEFVTTARPGTDDYPYLTLWGQFLDRDGQVRPEPARIFSNRLSNQDTLNGVLGCFPLKVLYLEASLQVFYKHYSR